MSGKAITSMVAGILSILLCWTGILGLALGAVAIVFFGFVYKSKEKSGMAVTGLVTGIIGFCISLIYTLIWMIFTAAIGAAI